MRWPLILVLSLHGVAMGVLAVLGFFPTPIREFLTWLAFGAVVISVCGVRVSRLPMANGFLAGFLGGMLSQVTIIALFSTYAHNNPVHADNISQDQLGLDPRLFIAIIAPPMSMLWGVFIGVGSLVLFKLRRPAPKGDSGLP